MPLNPKAAQLVGVGCALDASTTESTSNNHAESPNAARLTQAARVDTSTVFPPFAAAGSLDQFLQGAGPPPWPFAGADNFIPMDFTGDGKLDLLVRRTNDNAVVFYRSQGDGSFTQVSGWVTQWPYSGADQFIPMDFDGDHKMDLLVRRSSDNAVVFYRSQGDGSFAQVSGWATQWPYSGADQFIPMDFDGDHKMDLLVRRSSDNAVVFYRSQGDGSFAQVSEWVTQWPYSGADQFIPMDFNGDGAEDLLVRRSSDNAAIFLRSNRDGAFTQVSSWYTQWPYSGADRFIALDFDGDHSDDLYVGRSSDNAAIFLHSNGDGTFTQVTSWMTQWPISGESLTLQTADFNGDGKADLFVHRTVDSMIGIYLSRGDGSFESVYWQSSPLQGADMFILGDFDGDGHVDIFARRSSNNNREVLRSTGWSPKSNWAPCIANDLASLKTCGKGISGYDELWIMSDITCVGSECCQSGGALLTINNATKIAIRGYGHRIHRQGGYQTACPALSITNGKHVTVDNLTIDEDANDPAPSAASGTYPTISVTGCDWLSFNWLDVENSKGFALLALSSSHVSVRNSTINNSDIVGISIGGPDWVSGDRSKWSTHALIAETSIANTNTNAIAFTGVGADNGLNPDSYDSAISGNLLSRNHKHAMYYVCGDDGHQLCNAGGQIYIPAADHVLIDENVIENGSGDLGDPSVAVWGLELGAVPVNFRAVTVLRNQINTENSLCIGYNYLYSSNNLTIAYNVCSQDGGGIAPFPSLDGYSDLAIEYGNTVE